MDKIFVIRHGAIYQEHDTGNGNKGYECKLEINKTKQGDLKFRHYSNTPVPFDLVTKLLESLRD